MTDSEIEQWVLREFQFDEQIHSRELCVSAHRGIVTLDGTVPNRTSRAAAKRAALRARGVKSVVNNLHAGSRLVLRERVPHITTPAVQPLKPLQPPARPLAERAARIY